MAQENILISHSPLIENVFFFFIIAIILFYAILKFKF